VSPTPTFTPPPPCTVAPPPTGPTPTPIGEDAVVCRRTLAKEGARLFDAEVRALQKCEDQKTAGKLPAATDCRLEPKTAAKLTRAAEKLAAKVARACGGEDEVCNGDPAEEQPAALGFGESCPGYADDCAFPLGDCGDVTECVACIARTAATRAIAGTFAELAPSDPTAERELNKCQRTVGRELAKLLRTRDKSLQKCRDDRLRGRHADACPDASAGKNSARKAAETIAKAEARYVAKVCRACGGGDGACDQSVIGPGGAFFPGSGNADDLAPAAIGFATDCAAAASATGGGACAGAVESLADVVECIACLGDVTDTCVDRARVPGFEPYPCDCTP
jgi:hypothetical protein